MPARLDVSTHLLDADRRHRRVRGLQAAVDRAAAATTLEARLAALDALVAWAKVRDDGCPQLADAPSADPDARRLALLVALLERDPQLCSALASTIAAVVAETNGLGLFAETGLPNDRGILSETGDRIARRVLPKPRDEGELANLIGRLFPGDREQAFLEAIPPDLFARLCDALAGGRAQQDPGASAEIATPFTPLLESVGEALCLLAARIQALGLAEAIRARRRTEPVRESPFFLLPRATDALLDHVAMPGSAVELERAWRTHIANCRRSLDDVLGHLEGAGVSVDIVYSLDVIARSLDRMEALFAVLRAAPGLERASAAHALLVRLVGAKMSDRSLRELLRENSRLLARKIIERAGRTGEHYITASRREYFGMLASAAGGGVLTTGTAAFKILIASAHFPLFVEGFLSGTNYAGSFILMQLCAFTLATKQPSMTAATLAGVLRESRGAARVEELATQVARIVRSQLAAAMGNIGTVTIGAMALDFFWRWSRGTPFLGAEKAAATLASFDPIRTGTVPFAALTGVILWVSSLVAGWVDNFAVYHRLPQAIAEHRLGRFLGRRTLGAFSRFFARNISGIGGSIALGYMLGMTPIMGKFFGLPIDVRHVTLSTGQLALSAAFHGATIFSDPRLWWAVGGIGTIFLCNLGVSFLLALGVAMRARNVGPQERRLLIAAIWRRLRKSPGEFIFPPAYEDAAAAPAHH